jgi:hypothetical protein
MDSSRINRAVKTSSWQQDCAPEPRGLLEEERYVLELISLGAPLPGILNILCAIVDVQIRNVVSLVVFSNEGERGSQAITHSAGEFGLHIFCSAAILSESDALLGTLEILCCDPRSPTATEFQVIETVSHLAAVAIQTRNKGGHSDVCPRRGDSAVRSPRRDISFIN